MFQLVLSEMESKLDFCSKIDDMQWNDFQLEPSDKHYPVCYNFFRIGYTETPPTCKRCKDNRGIADSG